MQSASVYGVLSVHAQLHVFLHAAHAGGSHIHSDHSGFQLGTQANAAHRQVEYVPARCMLAMWLQLRQNGERSWLQQMRHNDMAIC